MNSELTLYHLEGCPFCRRVRDFMVSRRITIPMRDIYVDPKAREELLQIGGRTQVPCLVIDGKPLYESEDIIHWLDENWND